MSHKLSLVFCNTKKMVDDLTEVLKGQRLFRQRAFMAI